MIDTILNQDETPATEEETPATDLLDGEDTTEEAPATETETTDLLDGEEDGEKTSEEGGEEKSDTE